MNENKKKIAFIINPISGTQSKEQIPVSYTHLDVYKRQQLERLSVSQFQHGKKILLLDDLQLLFWKEENEKPIRCV